MTDPTPTKQQNKSFNVRLWHSPYTGGWVWFDKSQWRHCRGGWGVGEPKRGAGSYKREWTPVLWWCLFGFCGRIIIQTWPWQKNPGEKYVN
jgi:hypothetical protein